MKRVFTFKEGNYWDGDEGIIYCLEDYLLGIQKKEDWCPKIKKDSKITLILERL